MMQCCALLEIVVNVVGVVDVTWVFVHGVVHQGALVTTWSISGTMPGVLFCGIC